MTTTRKPKKVSTTRKTTTSKKQENLPSTHVVLRDNTGKELALTVANIQTLGSAEGTDLSKLSDQILDKVKIADTGELGDGINAILTHTRKVDVSKLGNQKSGPLARIWNIFSDNKQKVLNQFETSSDQIARITETLDAGIERMRGETVWLTQAYDANINYLRSLENILVNVDEVKTDQDQKLKEVLADPEPRLEVIDQQRSVCDALDKQVDKLRRLIQLAKLTAPQIGSMRAVNQNTIEKFNSLNTIVIPAWKNNMSLGLISLQQSKDNQLSESIDDETNRLLVNNSETVAKNMKDAAKAAQRGVIDIESLQAIQKNMLDGINETMQIENQGKEDRKKAAVLIEQMDTELKNALMEIAVKKNKA